MQSKGGSMYILNINCQRKEYRNVDGAWRLSEVTDGVVDSHFITSMLEGGYYFAKMGGIQHVYHSSTRKFKNVVTKIVVDSICGSVKCIYIFSYNGAKLFNDMDYF